MTKYHQALALMKLTANRQRGMPLEEAVLQLQDRFVRHLEARLPDSKLDRMLAVFDCMFSSFQARAGSADRYRLFGRGQCELCGSSVKIYKSDRGPTIGRRQMRVCRACGIRSEAPSNWEPTATFFGNGRFRVLLPDASDEAQIACAAVITTGDRVGRRNIHVVEISGTSGEFSFPERFSRHLVDCPVFLRIVIISSGRQATALVPGVVGSDGRFS